MSAQTIRTALGLLQDDPDLEAAWNDLQDAVTAPDTGMSPEELAKLLRHARRAHASRAEWDAVTRLLELEVAGVVGGRLGLVLGVDDDRLGQVAITPLRGHDLGLRGLGHRRLLGDEVAGLDRRLAAGETAYDDEGPLRDAGDQRGRGEGVTDGGPEHALHSHAPTVPQGRSSRSTLRDVPEVGLGHLVILAILGHSSLL